MKNVLAFAALHADEVKTTIQQLLPEMCAVLHRQLGDFHEGGTYGGPPATPPIEPAVPSPTCSEKVSGDLDFDMNYRCHCSTHQRSSTHMMSHKTAQWLNKKDDAKTAQLLQYARKTSKSKAQSAGEACYAQDQRKSSLTMNRGLLERQSKLQPQLTLYMRFCSKVDPV